MRLAPRILFQYDNEVLTGQVQNKKASDLEERSARAINKLPEWSYQFRLRIDPITGTLSADFKNILGEVEIDFWCIRGNEIKAVFVDGEISHFMSRSQRYADEQKTEVANKLLHKLGQGDAIRVPYWKLTNQAQANQTYRELLV